MACNPQLYLPWMPTSRAKLCRRGTSAPDTWQIVQRCSWAFWGYNKADMFYFVLCREHVPPASLWSPNPSAPVGPQQEVWPKLWPELRHDLQRLPGEHRVPVFAGLESASPPFPGFSQCTESPKTDGAEPSVAGLGNLAWFRRLFSLCHQQNLHQKTF